MNKLNLIFILLIISCTGSQEESTPISFVHYFTGSLSGGISDLAQTINQKETEYSLVPTPLDHETFKTLIRIQLEGPNPPDIFSYWAGARTQYLIERKALQPINELFTDLVKDKVFDEEMHQACTYNGNTYMLPLTRHFVGFFYNKKVFQNLGIDEPTNWNEFIDALEIIKKYGITPIALGAKNRWPAQFWFDYLLLKNHGYDFRTNLLKKKIPLTQREVLDTMLIWKDLLKEKYFSKEALDQDWDEALLKVASGEASMTLMGTWSIGLLEEKGYSPEEDYGFFPFPAFAEEYKSLALGPIDGVLVSQKSKSKEAVLGILKQLASSDAQKSFNKGSGALAPSLQVPTTIYNPIQLDIMEIIKKSPKWSYNYDLAVPPDQAEIGLDMLSALIKNPDNFESIMQQWEEQR